MSDSRSATETTPHSQALELVIGGKYRIEALLGEGGFARVYRARHVRIRKLEYAIKVLKQRQLNAGEAVDRFVREAEMSAALQSPYVVRTSDFGETSAGLPYIVMEFVYGVTVHDYVRKHGRMRPIEVARVAACVLRGLEEAHSKGIVHRDLKPSNIMLLVEPTDDVIAKVTDFGIAKVVDESTTGLEPSPQTTGGVVFCTPQYAGPEVLMGEPNVQSDLYALGHTMAEMLDGVGPFAGVGGFEVASLQMKPEMTRFGALTRASELYPIIAKASAKDLKARYQTASEMLADVEQAMTQLARRSVSLMRPMRVNDGLSPKTGSVKGLREGVLADFGAEVLAGNPDAGTRPSFVNETPAPPVSEVGSFDFEPVSSGQLMPLEARAGGTVHEVTDPMTTVASPANAASVVQGDSSREGSRGGPIAHSPKATGEASVAFSGEGRALAPSRASQRTVLTPAAALPAVGGEVPRSSDVLRPGTHGGVEARRAYLVAVVAMGVALLVAVGALVIVLTRPLPTEQYAAPAPSRSTPRVVPGANVAPTIPPVDPAALSRAISAAQIRVLAARTAPPPGRAPVLLEDGEAEAIAAGLVTPQLVGIVPFPVNVAAQASAPILTPGPRAPGGSGTPLDTLPPTAPGDTPSPEAPAPAADPAGASPTPPPPTEAARPLWDEPQPIRPVQPAQPTEAETEAAAEEERRRSGIRFNTRRIE